MPHRGQSLILVARVLATGLLALLSTACDRTGHVVVVLDSTMRGEGVEVVAFRSDDAQTSSMTNEPGGVDRARPANAYDDSAAALAARFRGMRDSLNTEVAILDTMDRRTRAYAIRYAEIRRRTLAAEQLRARRDSLHARADAARETASPTASRTAADDARDDAPDSLGALPGLRRHSVTDSVIVLELEAGQWSVGAVRSGRFIGSLNAVTITAGARDTVRLGAGARRRAAP